MSVSVEPATVSPEALAELAVFPLPDVVFFPGALLPLHVFEPRYRAMTADVLAGSRALAVARLRPGYEADYEGRPPIFAIAGAGVCVAAERYPDGRYDLLLVGVGRVRVDAEHPPERPYRLARATLLDADRSSRSAEELEEKRRALLALVDRLALALAPVAAASLPDRARAAPSPGACADRVAGALVQDADARQALLETLDPAARLDEVIARVALLLTRARGAEPLPS